MVIVVAVVFIVVNVVMVILFGDSKTKAVVIEGSSYGTRDGG